MLALTRQEKQVILFLGAVALSGALLSFLLKVNKEIKYCVRVDNKLIKIDLNRAGWEELSSAQGVSEKLARRIVEYRLGHGGFKDLQELKEVKGIGERRYEKFRELFFVE
jgi:competence ComEA-like helix-hairpin-helix protein